MPDKHTNRKGEKKFDTQKARTKNRSSKYSATKTCIRCGREFQQPENGPVYEHGKLLSSVLIVVVKIKTPRKEFLQPISVCWLANLSFCGFLYHIDMTTIIFVRTVNCYPVTRIGFLGL